MIGKDAIIAEVARRNGVLLEPGDPILVVSTMMELHIAEWQRRDERLAGELRIIIDDAKAQAAGRLAQRAAFELPGAIDRLLWRRLRRFTVLVVLVVFVCTLDTLAVGFWLHDVVYPLKCFDQKDGSRWCGRVE